MFKQVAMVLVGAVMAISAHASPEGETAGQKYNKPGFVTIVEKGRLWVFADGSKELAGYRQNGEPTISVMRIGEGPEGMTLKSYSDDVITAYKTAK